MAYEPLSTGSDEIAVGIATATPMASHTEARFGANPSLAIV